MALCANFGQPVPAESPGPRRQHTSARRLVTKQQVVSACAVLSEPQHANLIRPAASPMWEIMLLECRSCIANRYTPRGPDDGPGEVACAADSAGGNAVQCGIHGLLNLLEN